MIRSILIFSAISISVIGALGCAQQKSALETKSFTATSGRTFTITRDVVGADDVFTGKDRALAKTSIPKNVVGEKATDLKTFITALLAAYPDDFMLQQGITSQPECDRVAPERRIVTVNAFIAASKKESDNDFHVILCTDPANPPVQYFTAEVSGIPRHSEFADALITPRVQFKAFFKDDLPGTRYDLYDPPIPVRLTGPLFFDVDHKAGVVGPQGHRPQTAWEIHPVTDIVFK